MNLEEKAATDLASYNLSVVAEWIRFADVKASIFLTLGLGVVGASFANLSSAAKVAKYLNENNWLWSLWIVSILQIAFYVVMLYSTYRLARVVRPRIIRKTSQHSWFYFGSMAQLSADDFHSFTASLTPETMLKQLHDQIYNTSTVAKEKYEDIRCAVNALLVGVLLGLVSVVPVQVFAALLPK